MIKEFSLYFTAAFFEILGCYSFWIYFKQDKSSWFLSLGAISLLVFAYLLTKVNLEFAGRAYAVYGGVYVISSLMWLYFVEKQEFNKWDIIGTITIFVGVLTILLGNQKSIDS